MEANAPKTPDFPTSTRLHVAVAVADVEIALPFYRTLFGTDPTKVRPGYAKFEVLDPPVNFTLNASRVDGGHRGPQHFGVQVKSVQAVADAKARMERNGFQTETEEGVTCCWAVQDKVWAQDPDGHRWEVFVVTDGDAAVHGKQEADTVPVSRESEQEEERCCDPGCCQ